MKIVIAIVVAAVIFILFAAKNLLLLTLEEIGPQGVVYATVTDKRGQVFKRVVLEYTISLDGKTRTVTDAEYDRGFYNSVEKGDCIPAFVHVRMDKHGTIKYVGISPASLIKNEKLPD